MTDEPYILEPEAEPGGDTPYDIELARRLREFRGDPLGFVLFAYPWGRPGDLLNQSGPDPNQRKFLEDLGRMVRERGFNGKDPVMPIMMTATSGHGTGKSVLGAWLGDWILSTRRDSIGTVTAGTWTQLESRTWSNLQYWTGLCKTAHWFHIQSRGIFQKQRPKTWKITAQTCKEQNAQAFAGQHAAQSTSWYMFDEASLIPDKVWTVAMGGLSDGEPMWFAWGQPERNSGRFWEINAGKQSERWDHRRIDSRSSRFPNKELMAQWLNDYGEDSDIWRVRVLGEFPLADELQFIDRGRIEEAQKRVVTTFDDDPLIAGFDASGGGTAWNVIRFRRGLDTRPGRMVPAPIRVPGEHTRDSRDGLLAKLADVMRDETPGRKVAAMFIDSAFGAAYAVRLQALGFSNVHEVTFGAKSPDRHQFNMRAYMWNNCKEWLTRGAIDPDDEKLAKDLAGPGYGINQTSQLVIESKADMAERGVASPDDGDALCLTFAQAVAPVEQEQPEEEDEFGGFGGRGGVARQGGWMG